MQRPTAEVVVKRRSVRTHAGALNRRSWPLAPGSIRQQIKDRERQDQLIEILNRYSNNGLPPMPDLLALGRPRFDYSMFELESNWREIVDNTQNMTKKQQEHQEAVWELLNTEVSYIKQIRVIIDVFQNCLINVQQESFLNEIETERLFSNIDKVYECNCMFWQQYLLPVIQYGRGSRQPLDPLIFKSGFVDHFPIMFQVYFKYFIEHKSCLEYAKNCMETSDLFKTFITWAEAQKQCNRLKMADILVKPMQRLLKYSLLLQAIYKHTENESDRNDIQEMIHSVEKLCWAANNSLRRREDFEKLEAVRKTIDPYDAIEAPNDECGKIIQEYNGNFNLLAPIPGFRDGQPRSLLFHSSLRMKEAQTTKLDVDCLLFTDLIIICKSNRRMDKFKIIRPPMRLDQIVVSELKDKGSFLLIYMNEYHVPISAFTFHSDVGAIKGWLEKFREAQRDFKNRKVQESAELERLRTDAIAAEEEIEYTPLIPVPPDIDSVAANFPRSESVESADRFIPNLAASSDISNDSNMNSEIKHSNSPGDIQNNGSAMGESRQGRGQTSNTTNNINDPNFVNKHRPVQACRSVPNFNDGRPANATSPGFNSGIRGYNNNGQHDTASRSLSLSISDPSNHSPPHPSHLEQNNVFDEEDLSKLKLNSRRVSRTEKRYHTADAIQDMKNSEKDTSIHKRLSWRTDVQVVDKGNLGSRVVSTDSVRSIPSSSGVSSTGSLHLNLESDIREEVEGPFSGNTSNTTSDIVQRQKLFSTSATDGLWNENEDMTDKEDLSAASKQSKSKSTPDLVTMFNSSLQVSELEDGIASVAVATDGFSRKLTHADILKMKKLKHQVLYDANIESSEV